MSERMRAIPDDQPSEDTLKKAVAIVSADLQPVRTLPSDKILIAVALILFLIVSLTVGAVLGIGGYRDLTSIQRWLYYGTLLCCGILFSTGVAPQVVPGAKRRLGSAALIITPLAAVAACAAFIFPDADLSHFVRQGIPCLRAGLVCAAGSMVIAYPLLRRGYLITPLQTWSLAAFFAGFTGVGMLALHCRHQNWLHVVVWHLGAPVLSALAALLVWQLRKSFRQP